MIKCTARNNRKKISYSKEKSKSRSTDLQPDKFTAQSPMAKTYHTETSANYNSVVERPYTTQSGHQVHKQVHKWPNTTKKSEPTATTLLGQDSIRSQGLANPVTTMASTRKELLKQQLRNLRRTTFQNSCQNTDSHWHRNKYRCDSHRNTHPNNTYRQPDLALVWEGMEMAWETELALVSVRALPSICNSSYHHHPNS